ncbi:hypothetical protein [Legionella brunensis]|uniref:Substrate of the Dot/Icm secretion system n=1 Tax=Legionella brunensis TaxID=29422 RepID=A0A0W0SUX6_9GAMM|nr:hypothetical protein [Legionella brunensis]KTC87089.1 substrate of the Dot/Icm secretion system [Legionella brunensis]
MPRIKQKIILPDADALKKGKEVANTEEGANYLRDQFEERLKAAGKFEEAQPAVANIRDHAEMVRMQRETTNDFWSGKAMPLSDFQNFQHNIADNVAKKLTSQVEGSIKVDFAISDKAHLMVGHSINGQPADKEVIHAMDKLLNTQFAENNMISKSSVIYEGDEKGQIRRNSKGEPILADVEKAKQVVKDSAEKFEQLFQKAGKEIHVTTQEHKYTEPKAAKAEAVESAPAAVTPETPETPSTGPSAPG